MNLKETIRQKNGQFQNLLLGFDGHGNIAMTGTYVERRLLLYPKFFFYLFCRFCARHVRNASFLYRKEVCLISIAFSRWETLVGHSPGNSRHRPNPAMQLVYVSTIVTTTPKRHSVNNKHSKPRAYNFCSANSGLSLNVANFALRMTSFLRHFRSKYALFWPLRQTILRNFDSPELA